MKGENLLGWLQKATYPGQCIAINQSKSPVPGLVAQMKGIPMKHKYSWRLTSQGSTLLGHILTDGLLGFHMIGFVPSYYSQVEHGTDGLHAGIPTSGH